MVGHVLRGRRGMQDVINTARQEARLSVLLFEFDQAIDVINNTPLSAVQHSHFKNIVELKVALGDRQLPTLWELFPPDESNHGSAANLRRAMLTMGPLMSRAERGEPEPILTFAINPSYTQNQRVMAGAIQSAGRLLAASTAEQGVASDGQAMEHYATVVMDALLEAPLLNYAALGGCSYFAETRSLGWYEYEPGGPIAEALCNQVAILPG